MLVPSLYSMALSIQIFLKMNRADCAEKQIKVRRHQVSECVVRSLSHVLKRFTITNPSAKHNLHIL
jgi:hypothetical protein